MLGRILQSFLCPLGRRIQDILLAYQGFGWTKCKCLLPCFRRTSGYFMLSLLLYLSPRWPLTTFWKNDARVCVVFQRMSKEVNEAECPPTFIISYSLVVMSTTGFFTFLQPARHAECVVAEPLDFAFETMRPFLQRGFSRFGGSKKLKRSPSSNRSPLDLKET